MQLLTTTSPEDTLAVGQNFATSLPDMGKGRVVELIGDFGVGKTLFVKGILQGLGFNGSVTSPSYTYAKEYNLGELTVVHLDLWRVSGIDLEFWSKELQKYMLPANLVIIEWGGKIELPTKPDWVIEILEVDGKPGARQIQITPRD